MTFLHAAAEAAHTSGRFWTHDRRVGEAIDRFSATVAGSSVGALGEERLFIDMVAHCERASLAWPVHLTPMTMDEYRRGAVLAGPLFTSIDYPWPEQDGLWLEPLLQIDLAVLSKLRGLSLGSGWLQVWMAASGGTTRIVPAEEVEMGPFYPLPSQHAADYYEVLIDPCEGAPGWLPGRAINGFEAPYVDYGHNELLTYADWMIDEAPSMPPMVRNAAMALQSAIHDDKDWVLGSHRAFGMVNESNVEACGLPFVLFVIEPDPPLITDSSNGNDALYVCYEHADNGGVAFSLHGRGA
jgi:hypothetical protein